MQAHSAEVTSTTSVPARQFKFIQSGHVELGGSFSITSNKSSENFSLSPSIGFFVADHFVLGSQVSFNYSKDKLNDIVLKRYEFGPYASFYFLEHDHWVGNFSQQISISRNSDSSTSRTGKTYIGAKYFFSQDVAFGIDAGTTYQLDSQPVQLSNLQILGKYNIYF